MYVHVYRYEYCNIAIIQYCNTGIEYTSMGRVHVEYTYIPMDTLAILLLLQYGPEQLHTHTWTNTYSEQLSSSRYCNIAIWPYLLNVAIAIVNIEQHSSIGLVQQVFNSMLLQYRYLPTQVGTEWVLQYCNIAIIIWPYCNSMLLVYLLLIHVQTMCLARLVQCAYYQRNSHYSRTSRQYPWHFELGRDGSQNSSTTR